MRRMKVGVLFMSLLLLAVFLAGSALAADDPVYGGTLRWREINDPPRVDPAMATDTVSSRVIYLIFDSLVENHPDGEGLLPGLAESWEGSEGGKVWTFKLRKGVRFQKECLGEPTLNKGREVKAADWKYTFERMVRINSPRSYFIDMVKGYKDFVGYDKFMAMDEARRKAYLQGLDMLIENGTAEAKEQAMKWKATTEAKEWSGIKVLDDYTLQFELDYSFAPFVSVLAYNSFMVVPSEDAEKWGKEFNFHPIGTGAFIMDKWEHDQKVVLKKNPDYWRKDDRGKALPYLDAVEIMVIPDNTIAYEEFKKGNLEVFPDFPDEFYAEAKATFPAFQERPWVGTYYYGFNNSKEPFKSNHKLRQAFNYAVDRKRISELVLEGRYPAGTGVLPPGMPGHNPELKGYEYNPELAKKLMAEAGYPDGFECELNVNNNPRHRAVAEAIQAQLMELKIKLNIKVLDWGVHLDTAERGETDMFRMGWVVDYMDPDNFLYVLLHSDNWGSKGNYSFYKNDEVDKLLARARVETNWDKRIELYQHAEKLIVEDAPWVFLFFYSTSLLPQDWVKGIYLPAMGDYATRLETVWISK